MKTEIIVTLQVALVHSWPECTIPEVRYLANPHRHLFHITAWKEVSHDNREIELIQFKGEIATWLNTIYSGDLGTTSCERLARTLLVIFGLSRCRVMEDGENGAEVTA